jgi:hypothetical protein
MLFRVRRVVCRYADPAVTGAKTQLRRPDHALMHRNDDLFMQAKKEPAHRT